MSFKSSFGALEDAGGSWLGFGILILIWIKPLVFDISMFRILAPYLDFEGARTSMSFKSWEGALEDTGGSWLEFGILMLILIWSLIFDIPMIWILALILILKAQRTSMSFKSKFVALEDAWGFWLGFVLLILNWTWSLVFDIPMIWILALYNDFEGAKNIHVL